MPKPKPHPRNVDGPFYVEHGCCAGCGVPHDEASKLFDWEADHCFVSRQPQSDVELDRMMFAMWAADMECVRYRGTNFEIINRISEMGLLKCCDNAQDEAAIPVVRNRVHFETTSANTGITASLIAKSFKKYFTKAKSFFEFVTLIGASNSEGFYGKSCRITEANENAACVEFSWVQGSRHKVRIVSGLAANRWVIQLSPFSDHTARGAARVIDEWLRGHLCATSIQWWVEDESGTAKNRRDTPI